MEGGREGGREGISLLCGRGASFLYLFLMLRSRLVAFLPIGEGENKCGRRKEGAE